MGTRYLVLGMGAFLLSNHFVRADGHNRGDLDQVRGNNKPLIQVGSVSVSSVAGVIPGIVRKAVEGTKATGKVAQGSALAALAAREEPKQSIFTLPPLDLKDQGKIETPKADTKSGQQDQMANNAGSGGIPEKKADDPGVEQAKADAAAAKAAADAARDREQDGRIDRLGQRVNEAETRAVRETARRREAESQAALLRIKDLVKDGTITENEEKEFARNVGLLQGAEMQSFLKDSNSLDALENLKKENGVLFGALIGATGPLAEAVDKQLRETSSNRKKTRDERTKAPKDSPPADEEVAVATDSNP